MQRAQYVRLFADEQGESHFEDVEVTLEPFEFAPPAAPLNIAALFPAERVGFVGAFPDWDGQSPHPSPRRQLFCNLQGEYEVTASDGTTRRFPAGSVLLLDDTSGTGHTTRITSEENALLVAVTLAN